MKEDVKIIFKFNENDEYWEVDYYQVNHPGQVSIAINEEGWDVPQCIPITDIAYIAIGDQVFINKDFIEREEELEAFAEGINELSDLYAQKVELKAQMEEEMEKYGKVTESTEAKYSRVLDKIISLEEV